MIKGHRARKRFGQNFLIDKQIIHQIVATLNPQASDNLVEIGPGCGALTQAVLRRVDHLTALEIDRDLITGLKNSKLDGLQLVQADALEFDFAQLSRNNHLRIFGNLPYNIATPLLFKLLQYRDHIEDMLFMLQLEVVERIVAQPNSKAYGRLSIILQYFCETTELFTVPAVAFQPQPRVESAMVYLKPYKVLPHETVAPAIWQQVVKQAFAQRRKTLSNNLKGLISSQQLEELDIEPRMRPEQVTLQQYIKISQVMAK
jgi:16S rRNA (adenine1518-N6/adenine1519-N6)-dimethyltransferase